MPIKARETRVEALDGLRGLMAFVVFAFHLTVALGSKVLLIPSNFCVCGFFALSGYVLTRAWNGDFGVFLLRRFIRLWPVYAFCLALGYALAGLPPVWSEFFWYPIVSPNSLPHIDPPIWSLCIEAWAMLLMPLIVQARRGWVPTIALFVACYLAMSLSAHFFFGVFFIAGARLSCFDLRSRVLESALPQFLGRISYSLYLSHWVVLEAAGRQFGSGGRIAAAPMALAVGWVIWRGLELPSVRLSRAVGAWAKRSRGAAVGAGAQRATG